MGAFGVIILNNVSKSIYPLQTLVGLTQNLTASGPGFVSEACLDRKLLCHDPRVPVISLPAVDGNMLTRYGSLCC